MGVFLQGVHMTTESRLSGSALLFPWTDFSLRALEHLVSFQQQAWEQWFRIFSAFTPPGTVPADPVNAAELAGAVQAATDPQPRTNRAPSAALRSSSASAREHATADAGGPRRRSGAAKGRSKRK
jgi:hypothetical protein